MGVASNLYINWDGCQAVYNNGTSNITVLIGEVTDVQIDGKSVQEYFYGDNRKFPRLIRNVAKSRQIRITGGAVNKFLQIPEDFECTITAYLNDAVNGRGTGCIQVVTVRAVRESTPFGGENNKFAKGSVTFNCSGLVASDATDDTDPITITVAT